MNVLFIGDVVGSPGRRGLAAMMPELRERYSPDLVIANGENSAGGIGSTRGTANVPTADARVLPGGTAFISDVGMTGSRDSVLGVKHEQAVEAFVKQMPIRFETAEENVWVMGAAVQIRPDGLAESIEQVLAPVQG